MSSLLRLKTYRLVLLFYRPFLWISLAITLFQYLALRESGLNGIIVKIILTKLFFLGLLFVLYFDIRSNQKLIFYKNFGISRGQLFLLSFFMDALLTIATCLILDVF